MQLPSLSAHRKTKVQAIYATFAIIVLLFAHCSYAQQPHRLFLDEYAPTEDELAQWAENLELLVKFGEVPEFLGREISDRDKDVRAELEQACVVQSFVDCQAYMRTNRLSVMRAMPDNPLYWEHFWQLLKLSNLLDLSRSMTEQMDGHQRLLMTTYWWFYRDLADDGRLEIDRALALQEAISRWLTSHQTLITRMIAVAMQGIAFDQMSFAMAQASRDRDIKQLNQLAQATRPVNAADMSWGPILWAELEWGIRTVLKDRAKNPSSEMDIRAALAQTAGEAEDSAMRMMLQDPETFLRRNNDVLARHYVPISTMPWADYWSKGIPPIDEQDFDVPSFALIGAPAYESYITVERAARFQMFLFPALADIYAGRVSPGIPARPAPAHWRWDWQEGRQPKLCLIGDEIHPTTRQMPHESAEQLCVEYYDEAAVEQLHLK